MTEPIIGLGCWLGNGKRVEQRVALTRGSGPLRPAQAHAASLAGAIGVLHLELPVQGTSAAVQSDPAPEEAVLPVTDWSALPCFSVGGRDARHLLEWIVRLGTDALLLRIGPKRILLPAAAAQNLRLKVHMPPPDPFHLLRILSVGSTSSRPIRDFYSSRDLS